MFQKYIHHLLGHIQAKHQQENSFQTQLVQPAPFYCLKHEKMKKLFPLSNKSHLMNTRLTEKFKVQHAKTERLRKSAVTYMQNLLNEDSKKIHKIMF